MLIIIKDLYLSLIISSLKNPSINNHSSSHYEHVAEKHAILA